MKRAGPEEKSNHRSSFSYSYFPLVKLGMHCLLNLYNYIHTHTCVFMPVRVRDCYVFAKTHTSPTPEGGR